SIPGNYVGSIRVAEVCGRNLRGGQRESGSRRSQRATPGVRAESPTEIGIRAEPPTPGGGFIGIRTERRIPTPIPGRSLGGIRRQRRTATPPEIWLKTSLVRGDEVGSKLVKRIRLRRETGGRQPVVDEAVSGLAGSTHVKAPGACAAEQIPTPGRSYGGKRLSHRG